MDYDYERQNLINNNKIYSSDSPTSSSISSSSCSTRGQMSQFIKTPSNNEIEPNMTSSTSQIFATAASFQLSQNDAVFYSRETMHLLAKFLSAQGNNQIFRSLYAFAPDNLAWLWAFFDWTTPIDINKIPNQDIYQSFRASNNLELKLNEEHVQMINKIFINAPLIQYKYRENIMIADVYKFIEYILEIKVPQIAKSLFLLYFPRFSNHISNPLFGLMEPKLLKSNIHLIKKVDNIVISLIKSRYTNLDEYKEKILNGINLPSYVKTLLKENNFYNNSSSSSDQDVFFSKDFQNNDFLNALNEDSSLSNNNNNKNANLDFDDFYTSNLLNNLNLNTNIDEHVSVFDEFDQNDFLPTDIASSTNKTFDYMKQLEESNINDDLDHVSFDRNRFLNNLNFDNTNELSDVVVSSFDERLNGNNLIDSRKHSRSNSPWTCTPRSKLNIDQSNEIKYLSSAFKKKFELPSTAVETAAASLAYDNSDILFFNNNGTPVKEFKPSRFDSGQQLQHMSSPQKNNIPPLHIYTPKTPSNMNDYNNNNNTSQEKQSVWPNESARPFSVKKSSLTQYQDTNPVTPPPSAKLRSTPLAISTSTTSNTVCNNNTGLNLECIGSPSFNKSNNVSPPSFFKSNSNRYNEQLFLNSPPINSSSINHNSIYKQTNLYGSPVTRFNSNTIKHYTNNHNNNKATLNELPTFAGLKQHHRYFNSNSELPTTGYGSPKPSSSFLSPSSNHNYHHHQQQQQQEAINYKGTTYYKNDHLLDDNNDLNKSANNKFMNQQQQQHTWSGRLPPKIYIENGVYSRKVFLGGLPWDVNQSHLSQVLQKYGQVKLEVPGKDSKHPRVSAISKTPERSTPGYLYIIFDHESSVQRMLSECRKELKNGGEHYFFTIIVPQQQQQQQNNNNNSLNNCNFNRRGSKAKEVEVIPWNQEDTSFVPVSKTSSLPSKIDGKSTIFVGALHGMLNAQGLSKVMNEIFGEVIHASLDTDKYKYPIGSGRVTFRNRSSYVKAIKAKFVTIKANQDTYDPSPKFEKTIQIDPYLEEAKCCQCNNRSMLFCRNEYCLDYFCETCWKTNHDMANGGDHQSLSRNQNSNNKPVFN